MKVKIVFGSNGVNSYYVDGKELTKEEFDARVPSKIDLESGQCATTLMQTSVAWPRQSLALGVHPNQTKEAYEKSVELGCPMQFDKKTGKAIVESNGHQLRYMKALGLRNNDAGYAQVAG